MKIHLASTAPAEYEALLNGSLRAILMIGPKVGEDLLFLELADDVLTAGIAAYTGRAVRYSILHVHKDYPMVSFGNPCPLCGNGPLSKECGACRVTPGEVYEYMRIAGAQAGG